MDSVQSVHAQVWYHLGGRVETDSVAMAAARRDQAGIQRRHRLERRHGDIPSQTPPFVSLVARHEVSEDTEEELEEELPALLIETTAERSLTAGAPRPRLCWRRRRWFT